MAIWEDEAERLKSFREAYGVPNDIAVHAAFYIEPDVLQQLLENGKFDTTLMNNIEDSGVDGMFPIRYITKCWDVVLRPEAFNEDTRDFVQWLRLRNNQVKGFYKHWGFDVDKLNIEYWNYDMNYTVFDDYEDDFIEEAIETYGEAGTRENDVRLYMAGMKCNIPEVKRLLDEGANMTASIYNCDGCHKLTTDLCDESYIISGRLFKYLKEYWEDGVEVRFLLDDGFEPPLNSLLLWAGYDEVMKVLMEKNK